MVRAKCVHCPWVLQTECGYIFSFRFLTGEACSIRSLVCSLCVCVCTAYKVYSVSTAYRLFSVQCTKCTVCVHCAECTVYRDWTTFTVQLYISKIAPSKVHAYLEYKQQAMCTLSVQCCSAWPILPNPKPKMS
jgi:hypothetical protein